MPIPDPSPVACARPSPSPVFASAGEGAASGVRVVERLKAGSEAERHIVELRRVHGRALRVTGKAAAARARWARREAWLRVSYPAERGELI